MPKDLTPQKILNMLMRHIKLIFLITALVTLIVYGYSSFFITPVYSSTSMIMVRDYAEDLNATQPTTSGQGNKRVDTGSLNSSATLAGNCIVLFQNDPEMNALKSGTDVVFEQVDEKNFINITVSSSNPETAANVAKALADKAAGTNASKDENNRGVFSKYYGEDRGEIKIITKPEPSTSPVSPNVPQNTLIGLGVGAVLGILLAFFLEIIDTTLKPGDDLAKLYGLPVFAEIVDFEKEG